jgi:ferredoxin
MFKIYYIETAQFSLFFQTLKDNYRVFAPLVKDPAGQEVDYLYQSISGEASFIFNPYRLVEPLKSFFTPASEKVAEYFNPQPTRTETSKTIIFGVKNCDLIGHKIQDFVFLEGVEVDASYRLKRENTILISSDCTDFKAVCHCLAWDIQPYPKAGFDLNLSPLNDGYIVEVGSNKGEELIGKYLGYFLPVKETQLAARQIKRDNLVDRLKRHLLPQDLVSKDIVQKLVRDGYNLDTWKQFMLTCVECGGCNFICDTCHCFLLADKKEEKQNAKLKVWDACLYANYARVAGGANPLKTRTQRLRFRYTKKFDFFIDNLGMPACCGCGRCIEVCPGKIDIREVLKDLAKKLQI